MEDYITQAPETASLPETRPATAKTRTGADLIAAIQRSPYRELEIEPKRYRMPVSDATDPEAFAVPYRPEDPNPPSPRTDSDKSSPSPNSTPT
jgi:hypothetical protein